MSCEAAESIKDAILRMARVNCNYFYFPQAIYAFFAPAFSCFFFITNQRAPVMHTEEYAPHTIPTISGRANSRTEVTPRMYSTDHGDQGGEGGVDGSGQRLGDAAVDKLLQLGLSSSSLARFSRIRSKMTMVALMEYPTMVSMQAMNVLPTEIRATA